MASYIIVSSYAEPEEDGRYSAFCEELGIATCAATEGAALERLGSAIEHLLSEATKRGDVLALLASRSVLLHSMEAPQLKSLPYASYASSWVPFPGQMLIGSNRHSGYVSSAPSLQPA